jgi:phospholipase/lecithinase/hemolysin
VRPVAATTPTAAHAPAWGGSAGATTGLFGQLINWNGAPFGTTLTRAADPDALYVLMAGANDLRDARSTGDATLVADAASNVVNAMALLAQAGARHFLISNLPDLGKTPEAVDAGVTKGSTAVTLSFNALLAAGASGLDAAFFGASGVDLDIRTIDLFGLGEAVYDDAVNHGGLTYGITNVTTPCLTPGAISGQYFAPDATASQCGTSAYSDDLHPTAALHRLLGQQALSTAVPEPAPLALLALALVALVATRRRTRG